MIYLIGGVARAGKTTLAKRILESCQIPFCSTDALLHMLKRVAPELGITDEGDIRTNARRFLPYLKEFVDVSDFTIRAYLVEGDIILPAQAAELGRTRAIRACFLGRSKVTVRELRHNPGDNDWVSSLETKRLHQLPGKLMNRSRLIQKQAAKYRFPYFDVSDDYAGALDQAFRALVEPD